MNKQIDQKSSLINDIYILFTKGLDIKRTGSKAKETIDDQIDWKPVFKNGLQKIN